MATTRTRRVEIRPVQSVSSSASIIGVSMALRLSSAVERRREDAVGDLDEHAVSSPAHLDFHAQQRRRRTPCPGRRS